MKIYKYLEIYFFTLFFLFYSTSIFPNQLFVKEGAVVSSNALATMAGKKILESGGNAYDAAIAMSAMLSVVEPFASGLGGGAFWLIYDAKEKEYKVLDARETAPTEARRNMYLDENDNVIKNATRLGPLAEGIPGIPAVLSNVSIKYATKNMPTLLASA